MIRYILVLLLLVNSSYRSLGNPINSTASVSLVNSLTALAAVCKNDFLSNQIKSRIAECTDLSSPHGEKQLQCLMFYDMSRQLCEALAAGKITLPQDDYASKINEEQDATSLCNTSGDWVFSNLTDFSRYKQAVDKIFKHAVTCGKICSVEDLMSDDANFYCKFFKWGTDILSQATATVQENVQAAPETTYVENKETTINSDLQDVQIKDTASTKTNTPASNIPLKIDAPPKQEASSVAANKKTSVDPSIVSNVAAMPEVDNGNAETSMDNVEDTGAMPEKNMPEDEPNKSSEQSPVQTISAVKAKTDDHPQSKPENGKKTEDEDLQLLNGELENKQPALDVQKQKPQNEDTEYQDSEDGKDGFSDMQGGDDGDDPNVGDLAEDLKPAKKPDTAVHSPFLGEKEGVYANPIQDAYPEDDDNFFPFFLTAIILVVLLYVLYHNKNKVSKVFFGLLLEGRASRRRNSRGHAYKRLDTLEQAMSAGSTAPPSKIIY